MSGHVRRCAQVIALLSACGVPDTAPIPDSTLEKLAPTAVEIPGWQIAEGPVSYPPDDLYEYLDGGAERYLTYGFRDKA